jgi:hypothetical protein
MLVEKNVIKNNLCPVRDTILVKFRVGKPVLTNMLSLTGHQFFNQLFSTNMSSLTGRELSLKSYLSLKK